MKKLLSNRLKKLGKEIPMTYGDLDNETYKKVAEEIVSQKFNEAELVELISLLENDIKFGTHTHNDKMEFHIRKLQINSKQADKRLVKQARDEIMANSKISAEEIEEQISKLEQELGICRLLK
jgi:molybdopterin-biosynthesis enzyme MoeA-like protein